MKRRQLGFSFIEILVVMSIIVVLVGAVVVVVPRVLEAQRQNSSVNNVRNIIQIMMERKVKKGWPSYNGKNFVLSPLSWGGIDARNKDLLRSFFSPGDENYKIEKVDAERYKEISSNSLKNGDFHELTSYAGRRNMERDFLITPDREAQGVPIICDDDDGPLHHPSGLIMGGTGSGVRLWEWDELGMAPPADKNNPEPFLGDNGATEDLKALSSQ